MQHLQHIRRSQRIPRIEDIIVTKADVNAGLQHLFDARNAATFWISIKTSLQMNIDQRIGNKVNAGHFQQAEQARSIRPVIRVHCGGVAGGDARAHSFTVRQRGNSFDKTRLLIVYLIAVNIDETVVFLRQREGFMQRLHAVFAGKFKMRNRPHYVSSQA